MQIIDGRKIASEILAETKKQVVELKFQPVFCDVLVGDNPASAQYVKMKAKTAESAGIKFLSANFPFSISTQELVAEIKKINQEPNLCGLIVQLPLPEKIDRQKVLDAIDPSIDADCTGKVNTDLFYSGRANVEFPTAAAVLKILDSMNLQLSGKKFVVIGRGQLVGTPVTFLLRQRGYMVEVIHSQTPNQEQLMKQADVLISAVGKAKFISGEKIKPGSIIVDAGTSESDGGIVGDVDFESVKNIAAAISPVPGGVGPVTVAMLLNNVLKIAQNKNL